MFCPKCGKQLADNCKFCTGCGAPLTQIDGKQQNINVNRPVQSEQSEQQIQQTIPAQNVSNGQDVNMSSHIQKTQETENKNKRITLILLVILFILVLIAVGMGIYYFTVSKGGNSATATEKEETVAENEEKTDDSGDKADADETAEQEETAGEAAEADGSKVTSDTNEVVKDTVLDGIPKAVYSYDFDEDLGNAQIVVRDEIETEPEPDDDIEPQYTVGIDGKAIYLDGTYGIRLSDVQSVGTSYSVAFWMKADDIYDWAPFIHIGYNVLDPSQRSRLWLGQKTDGDPVAPIISSEQARTQNSYEIRPAGVLSSMETGVWYHIVVTVDGSKQGSSPNSLIGTLYVAGMYAGEGNIAVDIMNVDDLDVYLGINPWDQLYPVAFDSVKIWDQVLDADQVEELFNAYQ